MKWIGQHIYDLISRFRNKVYIEDDLSVTGSVTSTSEEFLITHRDTFKPRLHLQNTGNDATGPHLLLHNDRGASGVDGDNLGIIYFGGLNRTQEFNLFNSIEGYISEADDTDEAGKLTLNVRASDGSVSGLSPGLILEGEHATSGEVDVTIGNGAASTTTVAGSLHVTSDLTVTGDNITFESGNADDPMVTIKNTADDNQAARLVFWKDRGAAMADNDRVAEIDFFGEDTSQNTQGYGKIMCQALESDDGAETGKIRLQVAEYNGGLTDGLQLLGGDADGVVDVTVGAGAASTTTIAGDLQVTSSLRMDSATLSAIQTSSESFAYNNTSLMTSAAIDDRIRVTSKHVLRCNAFYVNDDPMIQNSLYFGNSIGNTPWNWNDPRAAGGAISGTSPITIIGDDENWGIVLPVDVSKIEIQCSLRPSGNPGAIDFSLAVYTGVRSSDSSDDLSLTRIGHQSVSFNSTNQRYKQNDLTITGDYDKGTMIYVGVGTEDAPNGAKNCRGYMNITVTER